MAASATEVPWPVKLNAATSSAQPASAALKSVATRRIRKFKFSESAADVPGPAEAGAAAGLPRRVQVMAGRRRGWLARPSSARFEVPRCALQVLASQAAPRLGTGTQMRAAACGRGWLQEDHQARRSPTGITGNHQSLKPRSVRNRPVS